MVQQSRHRPTRKIARIASEKVVIVGDKTAEQIKLLIAEGEKLEVDVHPTEGGLDVWDNDIKKWIGKCKAIIEALYGGNHSPQYKAFRGASFSGKISLLKTLVAQAQDAVPKNTPSITLSQNVNQVTSVSLDISNQIHLFIEYSVPADQKEEVYALFSEVKNECEKQDTNWEKVTNLLKKSFDYGLKVAPEIVKLASAYYSAKC